MTSRGGAREGAGRPARKEPKSLPIWCGQMSPEDRALILERLTPTQRHNALIWAAKGEVEMYEGEDRNRQVAFLQNLAANIVFGSDDPSTSAQERVDYYCTEFADELPGWFDDHDKMLLVRFVEGG